MNLEKVSLFNKDNTIKIRIKQITWEELFNNKTILFNSICDLLLSEKNLLYYATQKESSKTIVETKKYVDSLIKNNNLIFAIEDIFNALGWNKENNINNTTFQGDLAEYLMSILLDKFTNVETLISKVSFLFKVIVIGKFPLKLLQRCQYMVMIMFTLTMKMIFYILVNQNFIKVQVKD